MHAHASKKFFQDLPRHVRVKYVRLLRELDALDLSCRCELVESRDMHIVVGYGLARPAYWLALYEATEDEYPLT